MRLDVCLRAGREVVHASARAAAAPGQVRREHAGAAAAAAARDAAAAVAAPAAAAAASDDAAVVVGRNNGDGGDQGHREADNGEGRIPPRFIGRAASLRHTAAADDVAAAAAGHILGSFRSIYLPCCNISLSLATYTRTITASTYGEVTSKAAAPGICLPADR